MWGTVIQRGIRPAVFPQGGMIHPEHIQSSPLCSVRAGESVVGEVRGWVGCLKGSRRVRSSPGELGACGVTSLNPQPREWGLLHAHKVEKLGPGEKGQVSRFFWAGHAPGLSLSANAGDVRDVGSVSGSGRSPGGRRWQQAPVFLPGESHEQRNLVGYIL